MRAAAVAVFAIDKIAWLAGRITLLGVEPDVDKLVRNTVSQIFVQIFIDLVRASLSLTELGCRAERAGP
jgi:hypothetical protein